MLTYTKVFLFSPKTFHELLLSESYPLMYLTTKTLRFYATVFLPKLLLSFRSYSSNEVARVIYGQGNAKCEFLEMSKSLNYIKQNRLKDILS